jgi:branched-chain amino acid transport system substrate-binding protein
MKCLQIILNSKNEVLRMVNTKKSWLTIFVIASILLYPLIYLEAEAPSSNPQTDHSHIKFGMSGGLTGVTKEYGKSMGEGIRAYFEKINASGGIKGHPLELILMDDAYIPTNTASNVRQLINKDHVLALIGDIGTPTILVTVPIVNEEKTVLFAPYSGSEVLRKSPSDRYVFNLRPGLREEVSALIKGILSTGIKPDEIAFFSQNDYYGDSVYKSAMDALKKAGYPNPESLPYGRYERNTYNIAGALGTIMRDSRIKNKPFKAILMGGVQDTDVLFIKLTKENFPKTIFLITSQGLPLPLNEKEKEDLKGTTFVLSEVVPDYNSALPAVKEYREDLKKYIPEAKPSYISLEGYLAAKLLIIAVKKAAEENKLNRESLVEALESLHNVDLGIGIPVSFDKTDHNALKNTWTVTLKEGELVPVNWEEIKKIVETNQ